MDINKLVADELSKNYQINSFTKGMNSDTAYDLVDAAQYLFGLNIRITTNTSIGGAITSNNTEQIVSPVPEPVECITNIDDESDGCGEDYMILAVATIELVGAVVTKTDDDHWRLYRADYDSDLNTLTYTKLYTSFSTTEKDRFSITMLKEVEGVIKVYIADGINPVLCFFLRNKEIESKYNAQNGDRMKQYYATVRNSIDEDRFFSSNSYFPYHKARLSKISGNLKTQQVQYVYRYYRRYGNVSRLSPLTNKIQIVGTNKKIELGMAEDTVTDIGMRLSITASAIEQSLFDYVQIFRISFIKAGQQPEINLICDKKLTVNLNNKFVFDDTGVQSLAEYSLEEFSALLTQTLIPQTIEQNQNYLFAADVKDDTTINVSGYSASCGYVTCPIDIDDTGYDAVPTVTSNVSNNLRFYTRLSNSWQLISSGDDTKVSKYFENCGIDDTIDKLSYENMYVSSLLRSLRRDETYQYGIVYYDKYGNHSDVISIQGLNSTPNESPFLVISPDTKTKAYSLGLNITITKNQANDGIVGFLVVRCEKSFDYTKNIIQVALSRPLRQGKADKEIYRTPWYPNVFLSTEFFYIHYTSTAEYYDPDTNSGASYWHEGDEGFTRRFDLWHQYFDYNGTNVENMRLYQAFSPEINIERNNVLSRISASDCNLVPGSYFYENRSLQDSVLSFDDYRPSSLFGYYNYGRAKNKSSLQIYSPNVYYDNDDLYTYSSIGGDDGPYYSSLETSGDSRNTLHKLENNVFVSAKYILNRNRGNKSSQSSLLKLDTRSTWRPEIAQANYNILKILEAADVKNPNWNDGFSDIRLGGDNVSVLSAIKQYKSYSTSIGGEVYNNWVSNGMYNMAATKNDTASLNGNSGHEYVFRQSDEDPGPWKEPYGWIGPGPVCLLLYTEALNAPSGSVSIFNTLQSIDHIGTIVANIQHTPLSYDVQQLPFYGFGNFFELPDDTNPHDYFVFDGDIYPMFAEFTNLFKTYDFNERYATIPSGQVVYYIPLESKINTYFDYGLNYRNTTSSNLMLEPGLITGVASLSRPLHQYNMIYSDNDNSIDVFYTAPEKKPESHFPQRVVYSQLKTNGENVDNFQVFKPADFIDADSRYGDITNLLSMDTNIYFWLTGAFGKLSVNERSLVTDNSGETIQLGQGGVLQRTDYISTKYGMRSLDYSAISTENAIYWIDVVNKAILQYSKEVINYGEYLNVLNLLNSRMSSNIPSINYDIQHNELLCKCLSEDNLLIFNTKYNIATSVYTRDYYSIAAFNNILLGLQYNIQDTDKINYIKSSEYSGMLSPTILSFVVNSNPHQTKVFDNQKVVTSKRYTISSIGRNEATQNSINSKISSSPSETSYLTRKQYKMYTDLYNNEGSNNVTIKPITDREGNICYSIPRWGDTEYGNRLKGKWLKETIIDSAPSADYCISHIITKFRQSYS